METRQAGAFAIVFGTTKGLIRSGPFLSRMYAACSTSPIPRPRIDHHADVFGRCTLDGQGRIRERLARRRDGKVNGTMSAPRFLELHILAGIKIFYFCGNADRKPRRVERRNRAYARTPAVRLRQTSFTESRRV